MVTFFFDMPSVSLYLVPHPVAVSTMPGPSGRRGIHAVLDWLRQLCTEPRDIRQL